MEGGGPIPTAADPSVAIKESIPVRAKRFLWTVFVGLLLGTALDAASLSPSRSAFARQVAGAEAHPYQRARTPEDVYAEVRSGALVELRGNADYEVKATISLPFARPEVALFLARLAADHRASCGDGLVVTSLVRARSTQPRNAHRHSVHQLGLAIDLRRGWKRSCRRWLEANLLHLEDEGVLEATRERTPPHYHVALFTDPYLDYLERRESEISLVASTGKGGPSRASGDAGTKKLSYVVQQGDTLWRIATRYGVEVAALRTANGLGGNTIHAGQLLRVPTK